MKSDWQDPSVQGINRLKPHCSLIPCRSLEEALSGERGRSACFRSLNGRWKFLYSATGESPEGFESESLDDTNELDTIDATVFSIDLAHNGVGNSSCGPAALDRYRNYLNETRSLCFAFRPYSTQTESFLNTISYMAQ